MPTPEHDPLDELVRLQVLLLRRQSETQADTIVELNKAGFSNARIADLLGTTPATVNMALHRVKARASKATPPKATAAAKATTAHVKTDKTDKTAKTAEAEGGGDPS